MSDQNDDSNALQGGFRMATSTAVAAIGVGSVAVVSIIALTLVLVASLLTMVIGGTISAAAATCVADPGATRGALGNVENPTKEEVAASIYAQVKGFGYGDVAALLAIGEANAEKGLTAGYGSDNTTSRGYYQQFTHWVPESLRWSGKPECNDGSCSQYNEKNAWGPDGWATRDPRMNPAQSTNIYVLGSAQYESGSGVGGLEDPTLPDKQYLMTNGIREESQVDWDRLIEISHYIQAYPEQYKGSHLVNMKAAFPYYQRIVKGEIAVPPFVGPLPELEAQAHTDLTRGRFQGSGVSTNPTVTSPVLSRSRDDGVTLLGDSVMQGMISANSPPKEMFGGPVGSFSVVGINLDQVLNAETARDSVSGEVVKLDPWRQAISTGPSRILVQLGTNPASGDEYALVSDFMRLAGDSRDVYWFAQHYAPAKPMQAALERAASEFSNLQIIPVLDLLPGGVYQPGTQAGAHPITAYGAMWNRAVEEIGQGGNPSAALVDCDITAGSSGSLDVNPGSSELPGEDQVKPQFGYSVNLPGGRNMTFYSQHDARWNDGAYDFSQCGCGTTSIAMVIATLAGKPEYSPLIAAPEQHGFGGVTGGYPGGCGSNQDSFVPMAQNHGLEAKRVTSADWEIIRETLRRGGLVTLSITSGTAFAPNLAAHIVVVRGIAADGKFLIADPNNPEASISSGFTEGQINVNTGFVAVLPAGERF